MPNWGKAFPLPSSLFYRCCHFDFPPFTGDERASIQRACEAGVEKIIVPATEAAHFSRVLA
ncbi:hypothetical protein MJM99_35380, partial [Salmonella enterica subsp. enterica serovar Kentucky]|nr:hypothetical protein [Salmonella enterica subsp. enterica serovar Kentucky]